MNKYKEAFLRVGARTERDEDIKALDELIKRASPMKPIPHILSSLCPIPTCKALVSDEDNNYNFCPYCGQAIDWSDDE